MATSAWILEGELLGCAVNSHYDLQLCDGILPFFRNMCHGSDAPETGKSEVALWFRDDELVQWKSCSESWVYE